MDLKQMPECSLSLFLSINISKLIINFSFRLSEYLLDVGNCAYI